jgi:uncharacterized repeat protein (TIGR01451 family)
MKNAFIQPMQFKFMKIFLRVGLVLPLLLFTLLGRAQDCQNDTIKPICTAPVDVTVNCDNFDPSLLAYGVVTASDDCCLGTTTETLNYFYFDTLCSRGTIRRTFKAVDCSGNFTNCTQRIIATYEQNYSLKFPNDLVLSVFNATGFYGEPSFSGIDCEATGVAYQDQFFTILQDSTIRLERTWLIINWCTYDPNLTLIEVPNPQPNVFLQHPANLPGAIVSPSGTPFPWSPTISKITPNDPTPTNFSTFFNASANGYRYTQLIWVTDTVLAGVQGHVFADNNQNCSLDAGEPFLKGWNVKAKGLISGVEIYGQTNVDGSYGITLPGIDTVIEVTVLPNVNVEEICPFKDTIYSQGGTIVNLDMPVVLNNTCRLLTVSLSTNRLRRCFQSAYHFTACNLSTENVPNTYVEVQLDPFFTDPVFSAPATDLGNNKWSVNLDTLKIGECRNFNVNFVISCEAEFGATHCTEAHIFPDTLCRTNANWSGADVRLQVTCDADSVRMQIKNQGAGNMAQELDFVVVEDIIMYQEGKFQLSADGVKELVLPANGATWRLQANQEPFHPYGGPAIAVVEGCGGINQKGLVRQFPVDDPNPFVAVDCEQNIGSYDPNDKQAMPEGYGAQHFLKANTDLEYKIRFQNTGTDTAFNIVVLDTLSEFLDANSVRPGASSHLYAYELLENNVLQFTFNNIMLPDSHVNQIGSNGFFKFRVKQKADNPDGTLLENKAAIYFDFNAPIITNLVYHTIGTHFVQSVGVDAAQKQSDVKIYPNPAGDQLFVEIPSGTGFLTLRNSQGQLVRSQVITQKITRIERKELSAGLYFFTIQDGGKSAIDGKLIFR